MLRRFEELLRPVSAPQFTGEYWGQRYLYIPGTRQKIADFFPWGELNRALEQNRLQVPRLRLERDRVRIHEDEYTRRRPTRRGEEILRIDVAALYKHLGNGATLILDGVDEIAPQVGCLCEDLTAVFSTHIQVNAYATWGQTPGFGLHWDDHDVIVIQVEGRKRWRIFPFTRRFPLYRDTEPNSERPVTPIWEETIKAGDVIYIPRGQWHEAVGIGEPTLHLTVGINCATGITLLSWLTDELRAVEEFRKDLPIVGESHTTAQCAARLRQLLIDYFSDDIISKYRASISARLSARPHLSFPHGPDDQIRRGGIEACHVRLSSVTYSNWSVDDQAQTVQFDTLGKGWQFSGAVRPIVQELLKGDTCKVQALVDSVRDTLSGEKALGFLSQLIKEGLIHVVGDADSD